MKSIKFTIKNNKIYPYDKESLEIYTKFKENLKEGDVIEVILDTWNKGSNLQLALIYATLKEISHDTGYTVEYLKKHVKKATGLVDTEGNPKSFKECSIKDLDLVINYIRELQAWIANLDLAAPLPPCPPK